MALRTRRIRRQGPTKFRLKKREWIDPFPFIPGTRPEKMIFAALVARGIYFIFQGDFPVDDRYRSPLLQERNFKPDIIVPEWKVIYDPFSEFHHSLPDAIKSDAIKAMIYEGKGYEFVHPWSKEVEEKGGEWAVHESKRIFGPKLADLSKEDQRIKAQVGYRLGPNLGLGAFSVGIANSKRTKPKSKDLRVGRRRRTIRR